MPNTHYDRINTYNDREMKMLTRIARSRGKFNTQVGVVRRYLEENKHA